jgi:hypothetical protein
VVTRALRRLGVVAVDEAPEAHDIQGGLEALTGLIEELPVRGIFLDFTDVIPAACVIPMADALAAELSPIYERPAPVPQATAFVRLRAILQQRNKPFIIYPEEYEDDEQEIIDAARAEAAAESAEEDYELP